MYSSKVPTFYLEPSTFKETCVLEESSKCVADNQQFDAIVPSLCIYRCLFRLYRKIKESQEEQSTSGILK